MPPFRKGGSFVRFFVDGGIDAPDDDAFLVKLAEHRFRSIENAASEEISVGWVSPADPSGMEFLRDDLVAGDFVRLRMRIDRKRLPSAWLAIYLAAEVRARNGRPVTGRERREIKSDIEDKLLPRVLPIVQLIDVLWLPKARSVLLFSTSQFAATECAKLFHRTWGVQMQEMEPTTLALRSNLPAEQLRYLEKAAPFSLEPEHREAPRRPAAQPVDASAEASA